MSFPDFLVFVSVFFSGYLSCGMGLHLGWEGRPVGCLSWGKV